MLGFNGEGEFDVRKDNRSKADRLEKRSAKQLGGHTVRGSGSTRFSKGDVHTVNPSAPYGVGYCYQQKSSESSESRRAAVSVNQQLLDKTRLEAGQSNRAPVLEVILDGREPWYMVPKDVWQALSGERGDS